MCDHCGCRELPPIARMSAEHEEILRLGWEVAEATRRAEPVDQQIVAELVALLDVHVEAEETALYPLLVASGDLPPEQSRALEEEHVDVRAAIVGGRFDRRTYYELAAHIEEEEMELFPAAMFGFDDEAWARLDAAQHGGLDAAPDARSHSHA